LTNIPEPKPSGLIENEDGTLELDMSGSSAVSAKAGGVLEQIAKSLKAQEALQSERMAFEVDPTNSLSSFGSLWRIKQNLTPDTIIKRITGPSGDELVCQILQARSNHMSSFGRVRQSRFSNGFEFQPISPDALPDDPAEIDRLNKRIDVLKKAFFNCGFDEVNDDYQKPNFPQFLKMITRDGCAYGRAGIERMWAVKQDGTKYLSAFRAADGGTLYRVTPQREGDQAARVEAIRILEQLKNEKFDVDEYKKDTYKWVQVINGKPVQAFSEEEMVVHNFYPTTNVEYNGYPLTPIDQAINAITTHINITLHNKLYFQHGRAAKGFIKVKSDSVDESKLQKWRLQFYQSINSVTNSWRMPVFAVGTEEDIGFQSVDTQGRDAEFQYLSDNNARVILSSFQMSPDELPGYSHLSRGTNTQSLSESNNEYQLTAQRDVGLRPLIYEIQDIINTHLLPFMDEEISKLYQVVLTGLEADSPEKEATRLQTDMGIHMTYDEILEKVEKKPIGAELGGTLPLNQAYFAQAVQPYFTVGEILENFFNRKGAAADPRYKYIRDPFWMQQQQMDMQKKQMDMQTQMMQQQQMQQQALTGKPQEGQSAQKSEAVNYSLLEKSIDGNSTIISKMILDRHKKITDHLFEMAKHDAERTLKEVTEIATEDKPKRK
jgi:hypothetical protein